MSADIGGIFSQGRCRFIEARAPSNKRAERIIALEAVDEVDRGAEGIAEFRGEGGAGAEQTARW